MHWKYASLHWLYAAPVRVSAIVLGVVWVSSAARTFVAVRVLFVLRRRDVIAPLRAICRVGRVDATRVGVVARRNAPARVVCALVSLRVAVLRMTVVRPVSVLERRTVDVRVCVGVFCDLVRMVVAVPSRTADMAGAQAKKPRNAPKIRIFFISGKKFSKNHKTGASEIYGFIAQFMHKI